MCGIAGVFGSGRHETVAAMTRRLAHRGPDGFGVERLGRVTLGATRLSLLDEVNGAQPRRSDDGGLLLVYNGEIYNHADLGRALEARGRRLRGRCDTEVLLLAFEAQGEGCVESFEGMFAFAVTDGRTLWPARDAFGIKPLYYALLDGGRRLLFASELKAMLEDPGVPRVLDRSALLDQAVFGFSLGHKTPFAAIREVPPGTVATCREGADGQLRLRFRRHSHPRPIAPPDSEDEAGKAVLARLREAVRAQRRADHPVGLYLSGGLDSSLLAVLLAEGTREPVHTFATADRPDHPDLVTAAALARELDTRHHELVVSPRALLDAVPSSVVSLECAGMPTIAETVAPFLRHHVKAALCGDGADELLAGYAMHAYPGRWLELYAGRHNRLVRTRETRREDSRDALAALRELAGPEATNRNDEALMERFHAFYLGAQLTAGHLRRWDAGTMAHGLELRAPSSAAPFATWPWPCRGGCACAG